MPWYNPKLDNYIESVLDKLNIKSGTFLDLGTGPATQAKQLKDKGFEVTGVDVSEEAISLAKQTYPGIEFTRDDILQTNLSKQFDFIFDRGCFHVIDADKRKIYCKNVFNLLNDPGLLFLKCFSDKMPDNRVFPHPISEKIIKDIFEQNFIIEDIVETEFKNDKNLINVKGLFVIMKKTFKNVSINKHTDITNQ
ncbi:MAG TPA: class I SAM-dependent methyltransferase [Hanamia sp.]|nr:class I SAM-dependent methyltransferase [Hanamia sp.]